MIWAGAWGRRREKTNKFARNKRDQKFDEWQSFFNNIKAGTLKIFQEKFIEKRCRERTFIMKERFLILKRGPGSFLRYKAIDYDKRENYMPPPPRTIAFLTFLI